MITINSYHITLLILVVLISVLILFFIYKYYNLYFINLYKKMEKNSIFIGLKKGYHMEILPPIVIAFLKKPVIRILRVIGGVCVALALLNKIALFPYPFDIIVSCLAILLMIQITVISVIKFFYILYLFIFRPTDFEVRD